MPLNGIKIKELRIKKGLSQFELSLETNVSQKTIQNIERGRYDGMRNGQTVETLEKLAYYFDVKFEELLNHETQPK
jgi:transcriptional regulator with XRE-family HTH domain